MPVLTAGIEKTMLVKNPVDGLDTSIIGNTSTKGMRFTLQPGRFLVLRNGSRALSHYMRI